MVETWVILFGLGMYLNGLWMGGLIVLWWRQRYRVNPKPLSECDDKVELWMPKRARRW